MHSKDSPETKDDRSAALAGRLKNEHLYALGGRVIEAAFVANRTALESGTLRVGGGLARKLGLPCPLTLNVNIQDEVLRLGPLVGILTGGAKIRASFGEQQGYFMHLLKHLRNLHAFGYVFTLPDIDWKKQVISGHYLNSNGSWKQSCLPFPDVIYNRFLTGAGTSAPSIYRLAACGVKSFNTSLGSKWHVYQQLIQASGLKPCLPETRLLDSSETLTAMLADYKEVYIKSLDGHLGRGIYKITRTGNGYKVQGTGDARGVYLRNLSQIIRMYRIDKKFGRLIVQKGIRAGRSESHFDIRVLVQKDRRGSWQLTGMAARIGRAGQITTNLHTGGRAESLVKTLSLKGYGQARAAVVRQKLGRAAMRIAEVLESTTDNLGELGLDFVLDTQGQPWFLEANPRAGRRSFARLGLKTRRLAVQRPMEFACYLAGF